MAKKRFIIYIVFLMAFFVSLEAALAKYTTDRYYLPELKDWDLKNHTNLFSQYDGRETLMIYNRVRVNNSTREYRAAIKVKKPEGVIRIIVIGTSSTAGHGLDKKERFTEVLQEKLNKHFEEQRAEVVNAGVGGYVSFQLLVYFEEVLRRLSPDLVILYLGSNDNDADYSANRRSRENYEKIKNIVASAKIGEDKKIQARLFKYGLNGLSPVYCLLAESRVLGYLYAKAFALPKDPFRLRERLKCPVSDQEYVYNRFADLSKGCGFKLMLIPEAQTRRCTPTINIYYDLMRKIANDRNVAFVDVIDMLRRYPEETVFLDNVHLTATGNSLVGERLFKEVKEAFSAQLNPR